MKKEKVIITPDFRDGNPYQSLLARHLSEEEIDIIFENMPKGYFPFSELSKKTPEAKTIHLHWLSPLLQILSWTATPFRAKVRCILLLLDCIWLRLKGKKIIWTIHNKYSHENFDRSVELFLRRLMVFGASEIIVHSRSAAEQLANAYDLPCIREKANIIYHGNYSGVYPHSTVTRRDILDSINVPSDHIIVFSFGMLRPYKGLELLAEVFASGKTPSNIHLVIMGKADNEQYGKKLNATCSSSNNIHLGLDFLSDQELVNWFEAADMVAVPFSDTLTSGSVLLAMTKGKALLLPELSRVLDCVPEQGAFYYNEISSIGPMLQNIDLEQLQNMGDVNKDAALKMNWRDVAKLTAKLYKNRLTK